MENHLTIIPKVNSLKPDFSKRSTLPEVMDDLDLSGKELQGALDQLAIINTWLGGNGVVLSGLKRMIKEQSLEKLNRPLEIVDLGCGGGDTLRAIAKWARKRNLKVTLIGVDANDFTIQYAREHSQDFPEISYQKADCFSPEFLKQRFDISLCSLFLHHFPDKELTSRMKNLEEISRKGIIINDLQRHWLPFYLFRIFTFILRSPDMVIYDGSLSILRGFTKEEWMNRVLKISTQSWSIRWKWAFRYQILIHFSEKTY